jgi:hypothetical protein
LLRAFVSRLAENPAVSEQTIMALAGHVSKSMLARYSHIRQGSGDHGARTDASRRFQIETPNGRRDSQMNRVLRFQKKP